MKLINHQQINEHEQKESKEHKQQSRKTKPKVRNHATKHKKQDNKNNKTCLTVASQLFVTQTRNPT